MLLAGRPGARQFSRLSANPASPPLRRPGTQQATSRYVPRRIRSAQWALNEVDLPTQEEPTTTFHRPDLTQLSSADPYHDLWLRHMHRCPGPRVQTPTHSYVFQTGLQTQSRLHQLLPMNLEPATNVVPRRVQLSSPPRLKRNGFRPEFAVCGATVPRSSSPFQKTRTPKRSDCSRLLCDIMAVLLTQLVGCGDPH